MHTEAKDNHPKRRLKAWLVTGQAFAIVCRKHTVYIDVDSDIPDTAVFHTAYFDHLRGYFVCIFEDESFEEVLEGCEIPFYKSVVSEWRLTEYQATEGQD